MASEQERPEIRAEKENLKFAGLTAALGLVATFGANAIPEYNHSLENLRTSVGVAGLVVFLKGLLQALDASDRLDNLRKNGS